jgi:LacI family transcriptional regulator
MSKSLENKEFGVKQIARLANVSIATVDRVLHNRKGVSEATKKRINDIIKEFDYKPNIIASRLASKKVSKYAVLIPSSTETDFWEAPLSGIDRAAKALKQYGIVVLKFFLTLMINNRS